MAPVPPVLLESRFEYAFGTIIFVCRWFCRWKTVGFKKWSCDDYFSISAWVWFTVMLAMLEYLATVGAAAGFTDAQRAALPPAMVQSFTKGGKAMYASFYFFIAFVWSLKGCLLGFYYRLTQGLKYHRYILIVAGCGVASFVGAILTQVLHCLPTEKNWQVIPNPGIECSAAINTNIAIATGNVATDAMLIVMPFFLLKDTKISIWRKIKIGFLLSLGVFVMAMSLLRCILTVESPTTVNSSSIWAMREGLVAIFAVNAPILNALFKNETWSRRPGTTMNAYSSSYGSRSRSKGSIMLSSGGDLESQAANKKAGIYKMTEIETSSKESTRELVEERIVPSNWASARPV
ncbi:hypothetical protein B0J12DRAFT_749238 [Macrophomina phaseolina]|uniref:Rhodopsin domain-containing protein n=1 Tax=Macrophomina phaseolina TaxID=35725 RepID=A0ABQ8GV32_9PEZI|nr:hypothetical protein B0J12DRAFT_749238 [Macrophomina phaseolina]